MTDHTIRLARESEATQIRELIRLSGINPMGLDWKRFILAVNDKDEMIGCGQLKPHGKEILELASIAVVPDYRRQGIASAIIKHLLKDSPRPLYLTCVSAMGPFYQKFGFVSLPYDEMPRYFQRLSRLAMAVMSLASRNERLLVMKLQ